MSLSPDVMQSEQYGPVSVDLRCDFPGAEVLLVDGQQRLAGSAVQQLRIDVLPGVYTARVRIGEASRDERIVVRPDKPFTRVLTPPPVASAIPLTASAKSPEGHQAAARQSAAPEVALHPDADSAVFVLLREWTSEGIGRQSTGPLSPGLTLWSADGIDLPSFKFDLADAAPQDRVAVQGGRRACRVLSPRLACWRCRRRNAGLCADRVADTDLSLVAADARRIGSRLRPGVDPLGQAARRF